MEEIMNFTADAQVTAAAIMLLAGLAFCFLGLKIFKGVQFVVCAVLGGLLVLNLRAFFDGEWVYIAAGAAGICAGILGMKKYKTGLFIASFLCTYAAVVSGFAKSAYMKVRLTVEAIPDVPTLFTLWWAKIQKGGDVAGAAGDVIGAQADEAVGNISAAINLLQRGMAIALIAAIIAGVLALLVGDYVIVFFTAALGAVLIADFAERAFSLNADMYFIIMAVAALVGAALQISEKKKSK